MNFSILEIIIAIVNGLLLFGILLICVFIIKILKKHSMK